MSYLKDLINDWNITRTSHFLIGIIALIAAILYDNNIFLYIFGIGFISQSLLNVGCSKNNCDAPIHRGNYRRRHR